MKARWQAGGSWLEAGGRTAALLAVLLSPAVPAAAAEDRAGDKKPLREYARESQSRSAFGVYLGQRKLGWMTLAIELGDHQGKEVLWTAMEMQTRFSFGGESSALEMKERVAYELGGEGAIAGAESISIENGSETRIVAARAGDGMVLTRKSPAGETTRRVPVPRDTLAEDRKFEEWLSSEPPAGASFDTYSVAWDEDQLDQRETCVYRGKKRLFWGGVETEVFRLDVSMKGITAECEFLADGNPIRFQVGGFLELRAEEEARAKDLSAGEQVDMLEASAVQLDKDLGDPKEVESLTLRASGFGDFRIPESPRQRVRRARNGRVTIEIRREGKGDDPAPLAPGEREQFLQSTAAIPADNRAIRDRAGEVLGEEKDALRAAAALCDWVYRTVEKTMAAEAANALDVLHARKGDCTEHTVLFVALARAAGIPCREVSGLVYAGNQPEPFLGWHAWAEVHDGSRWVSIDPTWGQVRVDATHLKLAEGQADWSWFNLLGKIKVQVVEFRTGR